MPSVSVIFYTHKVNADGTSPIIITVAGKKRTLANVLPNQWDSKKGRVIPKSHPNYAVINIKISNEYNRVEALILSNAFDLQRDFINYFDNLKKGIDPESKPVIEKPKTFAEIVPLYISSLPSGFSMIGYEARLKYFIREAGIGNLRSSEITKAHMDKFIKFMMDKRNKKGEPTKRSTIRTQLKIVRYASSFAEREKLDTKSEAVHNFKLPIAERSFKNKLDKAEISAFKAVNLADDTKIAEMQDMFLLALYLRGMRIGDVIQMQQEWIKDGRIVYESGKNKKLFNIKLVPDAVEIVNKYLDGRKYLFTFFKWVENETLTTEENMKERAKQVKSITANINGKLKIIAERAGIKKNVSTHIPRHTFAKLSLDVIKGNLNLGMDLTGHSNIEEYQLYIRELTQDDELDSAVDDIFS